MALSLNTKAKGEFDFKKISVDEFIPEYTVDEALLTKDIERILKAQGTKIEASDVIEGDMVTISCESEIPKYSKNGIVVPVGKGMFSKELEEQLIGKRVGQAFLASVEGKEVSVNIEKSIRTIPAELADEVVAGFGMEGIASVNDLKRYCIDKQLDKILDDYEPLELASAKVWEEFGKMVEVIFDEDEKQRAYDRADARVAQMEQPQFESEEERLTYEQEYKEEFGEERAKIDTTEFRRNIAVMELKLAAFGFE